MFQKDTWGLYLHKYIYKHTEKMHESEKSQATEGKGGKKNEGCNFPFASSECALGA